MKTKTRICSILLVVLLLLCGMSAHALAQQYDVIVAGSGMAGLSAALTAAQQGASVILFEKLGVMGGSTALSAGGILKSGEEGNAEGTPTVAEIAEYITELNNGNIDPALRDKVLGMGEIGIRLTESGMMQPHASVSGLMFAHPQARYFDVGPIGKDQLGDYARRRGLPLELVSRFLRRNY